MTLATYYQWLKKDWARVGVIVSLFLFVFLFVFIRKTDFVLFLILLQTPLYMLHEAEEYVFPGGFGRFFNADIFKVESEEGPLGENFIFTVNILLVWILLPVFGLLAAGNYAWGLWIPYFSLFAGVAHIALALKARKRYNPGMLVSLFLNIPVGTWVVIYLVQHGIVRNAFWNPHFFIGLGVNLILPVMGAILYRNYRKQVTA